MAKGIASIVGIIILSLAVGMVVKVLLHRERPVQAKAEGWNAYPAVKRDIDTSKCKGDDRLWECYPRVKQ